MDIKDKNVFNTRIYLKNKILKNDNSIIYEKEYKQVLNLLRKTIDLGESNSALIIGPRSVGKTMLINKVLQDFPKNQFNKNALLVRLHGLVHTDDRLALKSITSQLELENAVDGKVFGSFAENLSFLLACLKMGQKETTKSVIFILDEFDLFCAHHNQTLLYNLFDISQSSQTPLCVIGLTCRLDVIELFEKRVKSRFSHRQIFLFPCQIENEVPYIERRLDRIRNLLQISNEKSISQKYKEEWNKCIKTLVNNKKFKNSMHRLLDINSSEHILKNILILIISRLNDEHKEITVDDFEEQLLVFEKDDLIHSIQDFSVLEICLIIAMKQHLEIYDNQPFNFEMILTRYSKFVNTHSNVQGVQRAVVLKAFEHLQNMEIISPIYSVGGGLQKEYQMYKLLITSEQIVESIRKCHGLPTEVVQWATSVTLAC